MATKEATELAAARESLERELINVVGPTNGQYTLARFERFIDAKIAAASAAEGRRLLDAVKEGMKPEPVRRG